MGLGVGATTGGVKGTVGLAETIEASKNASIIDFPQIDKSTLNERGKLRNDDYTYLFVKVLT
ncbi:hypothetical protein [Microcoleus sp. herbarium14]|uniref:hypothetical protein n=1 Tax=Microcoleus sp. herbarium14 TaxID=3055439 RepID=UPI002FCF3FCA